MPWADLVGEERALALDMIELALEEGGRIDSELALALRRVTRRALGPEEWDQALLLAARIVVRAQALRPVPLGQEPIVLEAQRVLEAYPVTGRTHGSAPYAHQ